MIDKLAQQVEDDYDFYGRAETIAEEKGCYVVYPQANQLQLDIDSEAAYLYFKKRWEDVSALSKWNADFVETPSKSGLPRRHITVTVRNKIFSAAERIAYQTMLGSDPVREGLNALRMAAGHKQPSRLFEPKEQQ